MSYTSILELEESVKQTLSGWTDHRLLDKEELTAMLLFLVYGQNVYSQFSADWTGASFSQSESTCLLVARRVENGIPQVAFCTGRTPTDCMRIWWRRLRDDTLTWTRDKYR